MTNPYESPSVTTPTSRGGRRVNRTRILSLALLCGFVSMILIVGGHAFYVETLREPGTLRAEVANYVFQAGFVGVAIAVVLWCWAFVPYFDQHRLDDIDRTNR